METSEQVSRARLVSLEEETDVIGPPGSTPGYASISVLRPAIWVELLRPEPSRNLSDNGNEDEARNVFFSDEKTGGGLDDYIVRITTNFTLEIEMLDFDHKNRWHNSFFDSVSLRYLFKNDEHHDFKPKSDAMASAKVSDSQTRESGVTAGVSADAKAGGGATPSLEYHVQYSDTISIEREMVGWRRTVSTESYPPLHIEAACLWDRARNRWRERNDPEYYTCFCVDRVAAARHTLLVRDHHSARSTCPRHVHHNYYNRAVHWNWQTCLKLHMWTPEVYGMVSWPITVMKTFPRKYWNDKWESKCRDWFHFDFDVEVNVRELGHNFNPFHWRSKPPEMRFSDDWGLTQRKSDNFIFCVSCPPIPQAGLPKNRTIDLQKAAGEQIKEEQRSGQIIGSTIQLWPAIRLFELMEKAAGRPPAKKKQSASDSKQQNAATDRSWPLCVIQNTNCSGECGHHHHNDIEARKGRFCQHCGAPIHFLHDQVVQDAFHHDEPWTACHEPCNRCDLGDLAFRATKNRTESNPVPPHVERPQSPPESPARFVFASDADEGESETGERIHIVYRSDRSRHRSHSPHRPRRSRVTGYSRTEFRERLPSPRNSSCGRNSDSAQEPYRRAPRGGQWSGLHNTNSERDHDQLHNHSTHLHKVLLQPRGREETYPVHRQRFDSQREEYPAEYYETLPHWPKHEWAHRRTPRRRSQSVHSMPRRYRHVRVEDCGRSCSHDRQPNKRRVG